MVAVLLLQLTSTGSGYTLTPSAPRVGLQVWARRQTRMHGKGRRGSDGSDDVCNDLLPPGTYQTRSNLNHVHLQSLAGSDHNVAHAITLVESPPDFVCEGSPIPRAAPQDPSHRQHFPQRDDTDDYEQLLQRRRKSHRRPRLRKRCKPSLWEQCAPRCPIQKTCTWSLTWREECARTYVYQSVIDGMCT